MPSPEPSIAEPLRVLAGSLPREQAEALYELLRDREHLVVLHETLAEIGRAGSLEARLRLLVGAIERLGFGRVTVTLRDEALNPTMLIAGGLTAAEETELRATLAPGEVWRRRLPQLERFRISQSYYLDSRDPWIAQEFGGGLPSHAAPGAAEDAWHPRDSLLVPLTSPEGSISALLAVDDPADHRRPTLDRVRLLELFGRQVAVSIEQAHLVDVARRRAEESRLLYEGSERARREGEMLAEVARAVGEALRPADALDLALRHARALLRAEGAAIALVYGNQMEIRAAVGVVASLTGRSFPAAASVAGLAAREGAHVILNDAADVARLSFPARQASELVSRVLAVPLITAQEAVGALVVVNRTSPFAEEDARVLQRLADHVAAAMANARLFEEVSAATREWEVAFNAVAVGMVVLDGGGRIRRGNERAALLAGVPQREDLLGRTFPEAIYHTLRGPVECPVAAALHGREGGRSTVRSRGRAFDVLAAPHPDGGAVVTFDDVTAFHALAERHRLVIETASEAIVITDPQRRIAFANPAAGELFGRPVDDLVTTAVASLTPPELRADIALRESLAFAGEAQRYETAILRPDGERRLVAVSTAPLREVGEVTGVVASLRDVTDERRARDAVVQSEARYRNLFESALDAIYTLDPRGAFTSLNRATCDITGYAREELLGRPLAPLLDPADVDRVMEFFRRAGAGEPQQFECHFFRKDGERRVASITNTPITRGSEVVGVLGIGRDLTAERRRDEALRRSEARYLRLVETASDAIFTVDEAGLFTSVNHAMERSLGLAREALLGRAVQGVVEAREREAMAALVAATMRGERQRAELAFRGAGGERRVASITMTPIVEDERVVGGLGIVRDVTEERALAEQLLQREKLAAVGQLVSGVAHELNNPLAGIMAFAQILLSTPPDDSDQLEALNTIHKEARRAAKIVSNLLLFARQRHPERTTTQLNRVISDVLELRRYALRTHQIHVAMDLDAALPTTWADPFQLQQVFLNLITNAEQALRTHDGAKQITLRTRLVGRTLLASVADSGPGIPADVVDRIFNPFYTTKPVGEGTGLGLSISDGIIREHGGAIRVETRAGEGATFVVELPLLDAPAEDDPGSGAAGEPEAALPPPLSVLVVDDEPSLRAAVAMYLERHGHRADAVGSGAEALSTLETRRYDVVLLDLRMPDMSGDEVFTRLRGRDPAQAARVVFATGDLEAEPARAFLREAGRPYVAKPFDLAVLGGLLQEVAAGAAEGAAAGAVAGRGDAGHAAGASAAHEGNGGGTPRATGHRRNQRD